MGRINLFTSFLIVSFLFCADAVAQNIFNSCGMSDEDLGYNETGGEGNHIQSTNNDGLYITAHGTLNVLVVFAKFKDDTASSWWGDPGSVFVNNIVDPDTSSNNSAQYNISNFFDDMSLGKLKITGEAISVSTPKDRSYYGTDLGKANKEVFEYISDNSLVSFQDFDNWEATSNGVHDDNPDGIVDMILIVWKGSNFTGSGWDGCAALYNIPSCYGSNTVNPGPIPVNGNKTINFDFNKDGSGVTIFSEDRKAQTFRVMTHELGHHLLGSGHPYGDDRVASLLGSAFAKAVSANSSDRERLGWDTIPEITTSTPNLELNDFITTGDAYKIKVPNSIYSNEYIYIENHQNVSQYDDATNNDTDKGLFLFHTTDKEDHTPNSRYIVSNGHWEWDQVGVISNQNNTATVSLFEKTTPNPENGRGFMSKLENDIGVDEWLEGYKDPQGNESFGGFFKGDNDPNLKASFNTTTQSYLSEVTNPVITDWSESILPFSLNVKSQNGSILTFDFLFNDDPYIISNDVTWRGEIFLDSDVTVQSGAKLSVKDATVYVGDNVDITIEGELYTNNATFMAKNNRWDYITFESGSEGSINETVIEKGQAYGGAAVRIVDNQNNIEINESTIQDFSGACGGISASNSSTVYIYRTAFNNLTGDPIKAYNSIIYALENNIEASGSQSGVYAYSFSDVTFSGTSYGYYKGKNTITGGKYGIESAYMSDLNAGSTPYFGNENRIMNQLPHNNDWAHIYASHSTATIYAEYNYWKPYNNSGGGSPVTKGSGTIYATNYLTTDPGPALKQSATPPASGEETKPHVEVITAAKQLIHQGNFTEARTSLEEAFSKITQEQATLDLLKTYLILAKKDGSDSDYVAYIQQLHKRVSPNVKPYVNLAVATLNYHQNKHTIAMEQLATIIDQYPDSDHAFYASILSAYSQLHHGNITNAESHVQRAVRYNRNKIGGERSKLPEESRYAPAIADAQFAIHRAQEKRSAKNGSGSFSEPDGSDSSAEKNDVTAQNHPNPFNPSTTISFSIPERSHVELVVYDLLGRKVATLASRNFASGDHSMRFNASALASGIYFYHLKTENHNLVKQMTLIK